MHNSIAAITDLIRRSKTCKCELVNRGQRISRDNKSVISLDNFCLATIFNC